MTLRIRSFPIALALACVLLIGLAVPAVALATDTLGWNRAFFGPADLPNGTGEDIPVAAAFNGVALADSTHGWAAGVQYTSATPQGGGTESSLYAFSSDGGQTWTDNTVAGVTDEFTAVAALPLGVAVLVGENGTIARFDGMSWTTRTPSGWTAGKYLRAVAFSDALHGWAAGDGRGLAETTDGGVTWTTVLPATGTGSWRAITAVDATHAWVAGDNGQIRFIASGSWTTQQSAGGNALYGIDFTDATHGFAVGHAGVFYKTVNGGTTWTAVSVPAPPQGFALIRVRSVAFADNLNGIAVGAYQSVWRTADGGASWTFEALLSQYSDGSLEIMGVAFVPGVPQNPVSVARAWTNQPTPPGPIAGQKAWAFRGTWSGIAPPSYNYINASAGPNGSISPSGPAVQVVTGTNAAFAIMPSSGYHIADVLVDGSSVGAVSSFQFTNVTANHTIAATFAIDSYAVTASAGSGGSISPSGVQTVDHGSSIAFAITPSGGYHIADVLVDGASVGDVASYTFTGVTAAHTIAASFAPDTPGSFTISPSAGAGGSISPSGVQTVASGSSSAFVIAPSGGYHIADVRVDGVSIGTVSSYTFVNVTANHTISASFAADTYTITPSAGAGGSISPSGVQTVASGSSSPAFTITPSGGYHIADVLVDGSSVGAVGSYTFTGVVANHTIAASFAADATGPIPTTITIKTAATATYIGRTVRLSGLVTPQTMIGRNIVVYVMKAGKTYWTYSSNRTAYTYAGSPASWVYPYYFKPGMARGYYKFKARAPAPGFPSSAGYATSESSIIIIRVR